MATPIKPCSNMARRPQPSWGHMTPCSTEAGPSSKLSPTPGFLKQEQEAESAVGQERKHWGEIISILPTKGGSLGASWAEIQTPNPHIHSRAQSGRDKTETDGRREAAMNEWVNE